MQTHLCPAARRVERAGAMRVVRCRARWWLGCDCVLVCLRAVRVFAVSAKLGPILESCVITLGRVWYFVGDEDDEWRARTEWPDGRVTYHGPDGDDGFME